MNDEQSNAWRGLRVLITSNGHAHYNRVVTITGGTEMGDGQKVLHGELSDGQQTFVSEGQYKLTSIQD